MRATVDASIEYVRLLDDNERFYSTSDNLDERLAPHVPLFADMHAELRRAISQRERVEYMQRAQFSPILQVEVGNGLLAVERRKAYALIRIGGWEMYDVDVIRGRFLEACRLLGGCVADAVAAYRAGVEPVTVRWTDGLSRRC